MSETARQLGWLMTESPEPQHLVLTEDPSPRVGILIEAPRRVVVCDATPASARRALDALASGAAVGIACSDSPSELAAALCSFEEGRASVPLRLFDLATAMPDLHDRQLQILGAVLAGQSNSEIARGLHLSTASVKRELGILFGILDVANRSQLAARALRLGITDQRLAP